MLFTFFTLRYVELKERQIKSHNKHLSYCLVFSVYHLSDLMQVRSFMLINAHVHVVHVYCTFSIHVYAIKLIHMYTLCPHDLTL